MNNMARIKVEDNPSLCRDTESNGIINVDKEAYKAHLRRKEIERQKMLEKMNSERRLNMIESEVKELKQGIAQILEILKNDRS